MTEHHEAAQLSFLLHGLEAQQGPEGFACSWPGMHQDVSAFGAGGIEAAPEQLDQLLLPQPWPDAGLLRLGTQLERR